MAETSKSYNGFIIKSVTISICFSIVFVFCFEWVLSGIHDEIGSAIHSVGGSKFWGKLETELDHAAHDDTVTDEKMEKFKANIRLIVKRWSPLIEEFKIDVSKK